MPLLPIVGQRLCQDVRRHSRCALPGCAQKHIDVVVMEVIFDTSSCCECDHHLSVARNMVAPADETRLHPSCGCGRGSELVRTPGPPLAGHGNEPAPRVERDPLADHRGLLRRMDEDVQAAHRYRTLNLQRRVAHMIKHTLRIAVHPAGVVDDVIQVVAGEPVAEHDPVRQICHHRVADPRGQVGRRSRTAIDPHRALAVAGSPARQPGQRGR